MSGSGKAGNGRGSNRRRPFRRRPGETTRQEDDIPQINENTLKESATGVGYDARKAGHNRMSKKGNDNSQNAQKSNRTEKVRQPYIDRPKWVPPKFNTNPLPVPDCPWCGKPIRDISQAIADKDTGEPIHFECVTARISEIESLEKGDTVTYIGGGRFGIVNFGNSAVNPKDTQQENREFTIKKIIEWENKEKKAEWRSEICDHYSVI